nr:MAG: hypothetical protein [Bacteriophage sp.]
MGIISHIHVETPYLLRIAVLFAYWHNLPINDLELIYGQIRKPFFIFREKFEVWILEEVFLFLGKNRAGYSCRPPSP